MFYPCNMQGKKQFTQQLFYELSLERLVPQDNFYREVDKLLDLHFLYAATNKTLNQYEFIQAGGNKAILPFKGVRTDSKGYAKKTFRSSEKDCKNCPLRAACYGQTTKFKKLDESIHKPLYDK